jgi:hypothetical protein
LGEDIRNRLNTLGFDCLGIPEQLEVIVLVDDPESSEAPLATSRIGSDANAILTNSEATPDTEDDSTTKMLAVKVKFEMSFFEGKSQEPTQDEVDGLIRETRAYFIEQFSTNPDYADAFISFSMKNIAHTYDESNDKDQFELDFLAGVEMLKTSRRTAYQASEIMSHMDVNEYISDYIWKAPPLERSEFYQTHFVKLISKPMKAF